MDAREYLARKGLDGERDRERPNTLEEKAWERARESGDHRPRAGTPHDWEDWERYHDELAEGADGLTQKIDHEAHRQALEHESTSARPAASAVGEWTPESVPSASTEPARSTAEPASSSPSTSTSSSASEPAPGRPEPFGALLALALLLPPLAMGLAGGGSRRVWIAVGLTLLGWLPGMAYVLHTLLRARG
ncbi:YqaE/Pmp3 family membrane protein [Halomonas getboli]|uniref:YqaE/Pmp3 family membrane protein n=1 Tax=Halomonas getboli TaxID=2935862 RepID=UPI001FFEA4D5|nr:YqaE/Pmp3 family membrane protein [Halomonas getboli]MCK2182477.1 YqaE/Pmp3 family membrane protein [Halomonas getboli]